MSAFPVVVLTLILRHLTLMDLRRCVVASPPTRNPDGFPNVVRKYLRDTKKARGLQHVFVQTATDDQHRYPLFVSSVHSDYGAAVSALATHNTFCHHVFLRTTDDKLDNESFNHSVALQCMRDRQRIYGAFRADHGFCRSNVPYKTQLTPDTSLFLSAATAKEADGDISWGHRLFPRPSKIDQGVMVSLTPRIRSLVSTCALCECKFGERCSRTFFMKKYLYRRGLLPRVWERRVDSQPFKYVFAAGLQLLSAPMVTLIRKKGIDISVAVQPESHLYTLACDACMYYHERDDDGVFGDSLYMYVTQHGGKTCDLREVLSDIAWRGELGVVLEPKLRD